MKPKIEILLITNKTDVTTDFIVKSLSNRRIEFYRLNTEEIGISVDVLFNFFQNTYKLFDKNLTVEVDLLKIKAVYFRRPEIRYQFDNSLTEGEVNFIKSEMLFTLEGVYKILNNAYWLNNVYDIRNSENKVFQMMLAKDIGLSIPNSLITNDPTHAYNFYKRNNSSCIIKPIKSGLIEGEKEEGVIFTSHVILNEENINRIEPCPVYLQNLIDKKGDIRVTVVEDELFPAFIDSQVKKEAQIDWRRSAEPLTHSKITLPDDIVTKCLLLTKKLKLNFAAIDFVVDSENNFIFLEINPNGQWAWIEKQLNYPIAEKITTILIEKSLNKY
ncbi:MAG TPA: hypothetical protein VMU83_21860 [Hanamia sp.]|nr:hypothetical protein [Hanamia sp.]